MRASPTERAGVGQRQVAGGQLMWSRPAQAGTKPCSALAGAGTAARYARGELSRSGRSPHNTWATSHVCEITVAEKAASRATGSYRSQRCWLAVPKYKNPRGHLDFTTTFRPVLPEGMEPRHGGANNSASSCEASVTRDRIAQWLLSIRRLDFSPCFDGARPLGRLKPGGGDSRWRWAAMIRSADLQARS